jgi:hypothetical protein
MSAVSSNATPFGGKAWEAVNSYTTTDNGRTATRDRFGVREKKLSQGEGEEEEGWVGGRTTVDDPVFCVKGIDEGKRPSAAAMYEKENDTGAKVCGKRRGERNEWGRGGAEKCQCACACVPAPPSLSLRSAAHILPVSHTTFYCYSRSPPPNTLSPQIT